MVDQFKPFVFDTNPFIGPVRSMKEPSPRGAGDDPPLWMANAGRASARLNASRAPFRIVSWFCFGCGILRTA